MAEAGLLTDRRVLAWASYDWANSAFATTVISGFFPIFFKGYWSHGVDATQSSFYLGLANSAGSLLVVLLAPFLGAMADQCAGRKRYLIRLAAIGIAMTFSLALVGKGQWMIAAAVYVLAGFGFAGGNVFYDALLLAVSQRRDLDRVSALGYGFGYLGGGLLFALNVLMTLHPGWFGLADAGQAVRLAFVSVALWWAVFSLPLLLVVPEPDEVPARRAGPLARAAIAQLADTFRGIRELRGVLLLLVAYWFYIDGVHTIIRMAVDYGMSLGFDPDSLIVALLITQFVGFPAALAFGRIGYRFGAKPGIFLGLVVYTGVSVWGYFMTEIWEFYVLAVAVGLVQGGVQALSRSLYASLVPEPRSAEFFGFFNMMGKFAAVLGPVLMGSVGLLTGSTRASILSVIVLFAVGAFLLRLVPTAPPPRRAEVVG